MNKQRSLVGQMLQSEVNATLERFSQLGVSLGGMMSIMKGRHSHAFGKQLASCINRLSFETSVSLAQFVTFKVKLGLPGIAKLMEDERFHFRIDPGAGIPNSSESSIPSLFKDLAPADENFIILEEMDFCSIQFSDIKVQLDNNWLRDWSRDNMLGITLKLCRSDAPPYLADLCRTFLNRDLEMILIAAEPNDNFLHPIGFQKQGNDLYFQCFPKEEGRFLGKMIFAYDKMKT